MTRTTNFIIAIILSISGIYSQQKFVPGYILKTEKDTLFGFINYDESKTDINKCQFRKSESSVVKVFNSNQIYGYKYYNGRYFVTKTLENDTEKDTLFIEILSSGKLNFYFYKDQNNDNHYIFEKKELPIKDFCVADKLLSMSGNEYQSKISTNRDELKKYFSGNSEILAEIDWLSFSEPKTEIAKLVDEYNTIDQRKATNTLNIKGMPKHYNFELETLLGPVMDFGIHKDPIWCLKTGLNIYWTLPIITKKSKLLLKTGINIYTHKSLTRTESGIYGSFPFEYPYTREIIIPAATTIYIPIQIQVKFSDNTFTPLFSFGVNVTKKEVLPYFSLGGSYKFTENISVNMGIDLETDTPFFAPVDDETDPKGISTLALSMALRYRF